MLSLLNVIATESLEPHDYTADFGKVHYFLIQGGLLRQLGQFWDNHAGQQWMTAHSYQV